jgi:hypothetical protein
VKTSEWIAFLQKDLEARGDRDVVLTTDGQLLPNTSYDIFPDLHQRGELLTVAQHGRHVS